MNYFLFLILIKHIVSTAISEIIAKQHTDYNLNVEDEEGEDLITEGVYPKGIGKNKYKLYFRQLIKGKNVILKTIVLPPMKLNQECQITITVPQK
ncbi:hypothetical protein ACQKM9_08965 [Viridibacillus sp. NPDC093762]|uniref:hypothetical protein n=1 Tax=Viridibacillus sp. NPDC093762 TaxID=3390720 RepID=UPI003CFEC638